MKDKWKNQTSKAKDLNFHTRMRLPKRLRMRLPKHLRMVFIFLASFFSYYSRSVTSVVKFWVFFSHLTLSRKKKSAVTSELVRVSLTSKDIFVRVPLASFSKRLHLPTFLTMNVCSEWIKSQTIFLESIETESEINFLWVQKLYRRQHSLILLLLIWRRRMVLKNPGSPAEWHCVAENT